MFMVMLPLKIAAGVVMWVVFLPVRAVKFAMKLVSPI